MAKGAAEEAKGSRRSSELDRRDLQEEFDAPVGSTISS
jgi:hypothetical protein